MDLFNRKALLFIFDFLFGGVIDHWLERFSRGVGIDVSTLGYVVIFLQEICQLEPIIWFSQVYEASVITSDNVECSCFEATLSLAAEV